MNNQLVKTLMVEIDGNMEKLRRALKDGETGLKDFETKSTRAGATSGAAADVVATKQAGAARAIAMTTETIARQGAVSAESAKQVIAQGSNMAMSFGPTGAIVGAIGISTLAIVAMFTRVRREAEETARKTREEFMRMSQLDLVGVSQQVQQLDSGNFMLREGLAGRGILSRAEAEKVFQDDRTVAGDLGLREERARVQARLDAIGIDRSIVIPSSEQTADYRAKSMAALELEQELAAIDAAINEIEPRLKFARALLAERSTQEGERAANYLAQWKRDAQAKKSTDDQRDAKNAANSEQQLRDRIATQSSAVQEAIYARFQTALLDGFSGTREDIEKSFEELIRFAEEHGEQAEIPVLRRARDQALELNAAMTQSAQLLGKLAEGDLKERIVASGERDRSGPEESEIARLEAARNRFRAIAADTSRSEKDRRAASGEVLKLQTEIERRVSATARARDKETNALIQQAQAIGQTIDGVLQMAGAWGNVRREVIDTLRGIVQIGSNVPNMMDKLGDLRKAQSGKLKDKEGNLIGVGAAAASFAGAALPVIGALTTIAGSLFGDSPREQERKRVQSANTKAIEKLSSEIGSLGIAISGAQLGEARESVSALTSGQMRGNALQLREDARRLAQLQPGLNRVFEVSDFRDSARVNWRELEAEGIDRKAMEEAAELLDITLDGTVGSFRRLQEAIAAFEGKIAEFGDSYSERRTIGDAIIDAKQITDPIERALERSKPAQEMSPIVQQLLANADLGSAAGREELRKQIVAIFETMQPGGDAISETQLGELTRDQLFDFLNEFLGSLDEIESNVPGSGSSVGGISGFRGLTEAAGERMADYLRGIYASATTAEGQRTRMIEHLAELTALARTPLAVPVLPSTSAAIAASRSSGAGALVIEGFRVDIGGIVLNLDREQSDDSASITSEVLASVSAQIEQVMYDVVRRAQKQMGDLSVAPPRAR